MGAKPLPVGTVTRVVVSAPQGDSTFSTKPILQNPSRHGRAAAVSVHGVEPQGQGSDAAMGNEGPPELTLSVAGQAYRMPQGEGREANGDTGRDNAKLRTTRAVQG